MDAHSYDLGGGDGRDQLTPEAEDEYWGRISVDFAMSRL